MQDDHAHSPESATQSISNSNPSPPEKESPRRKTWPRFSDERRFGSITGSDFRIWGE
jgi:hypothetical protein